MEAAFDLILSRLPGRDRDILVALLNKGRVGCTVRRRGAGDEPQRHNN